MNRFHAVGIVAPATGETTDDLADRVGAVGCDYLGDDDATAGAIVSCGPFLSTGKNMREVAGDARHHLARVTQRRVLAILNVTNEAHHVIDIPHVRHTTQSQETP